MSCDRGSILQPGETLFQKKFKYVVSLCAPCWVLYSSCLKSSPNGLQKTGPVPHFTDGKTEAQELMSPVQGDTARWWQGQDWNLGLQFPNLPSSSSSLRGIRENVLPG